MITVQTQCCELFIEFFNYKRLIFTIENSASVFLPRCRARSYLQLETKNYQLKNKKLKKWKAMYNSKSKN